MQMAIGLLTTGLKAVTGGGAAATTTAATAAGGAAASGGGFFSLSNLMQGAATLLAATSQINAGNADAERYELAAIDAEREQPLETLQGIQRRSSIKAELAESIGDMDTAYAASGVDLSFGTPGQARTRAYREADYALTADNSTQQTRQARLTERSASYRRMGQRAKRRGYTNALVTGLSYGGQLAGRFG
ncbi:MAG: hypothetical protein JJ866_27180 [Roseibium sp.]|uniref:hypothetical protein n=1 Tax=Roseibium sp. TaxID=1936156 RepID=UPI001B1C78FF|nr:hypothetical protein [Roseibium sp.]MBO6895638.1 hypothetical protein [Roseibium sp.]MBO6930730.1 hypothetical protein [Roseibium sp.]